MSFLGKIVANIGASAIVKVFSGIAGPILKHYQHKARQVTLRQSTWANALVSAAETDVRNRKLAMAERASSKWLMLLYINLVFWPSLYYTLFWIDTIFPMDWNLTRAPVRLEEAGKYIIMTFLGGGSATFAVIKGARILGNAGIFKGK